MQLEIYAVGQCDGDGTMARVAGCGITLVQTDDQRRVIRRELGFALSNSSLELANLQAVRLALATVKPLGRVGVTTVHIASAKTFRQLNLMDGKYQEDSEFTTALTEAREWLKRFPNVLLHMAPTSANLSRAIELARIALTSQKHYDSGTIMP